MDGRSSSRLRTAGHLSVLRFEEGCRRRASVGCAAGLVRWPQRTSPLSVMCRQRRSGALHSVRASGRRWAARLADALAPASRPARAGFSRDLTEPASRERERRARGQAVLRGARCAWRSALQCCLCAERLRKGRPPGSGGAHAVAYPAAQGSHPKHASAALLRALPAPQPPRGRGVLAPHLLLQPRVGCPTVHRSAGKRRLRVHDQHSTPTGSHSRRIKTGAAPLGDAKARQPVPSGAIGARPLYPVWEAR